MYEYKILQAEDPGASVEQLNEMGAEGWELVTIVEWMGKWVFWFKRLKPTQ